MIEVEWADDTQKIVILRFRDKWTWQQFFDAQKKTHALVDTVPDKVIYGIILPSKQQLLPPNPLSHFRKGLVNIHPRYKGSVMVGANAFSRLMLTTVLKVMGNDDLSFANSVAEAYAFIATQREKHPQ